MKKISLLIALVLLGSTGAQARVPQFITSANYAWIAANSGLPAIRTMDCWFQTTGDTIPVQIIWRNFLVNNLATTSFKVRFPGAVHMSFTGTAPDRHALSEAYIMNNDYEGEYAKKLLGVSCDFK